MNEPIQNVFLQGLMVVGDVLPLPNGEGVVAVRENDGKQLVFIVKEVASMDVCDGYFVLSPEIITFSAFFYEVVVCKHKKLDKGSGAGPSSSGCGDEILQWSVLSYGRK